MFSNFLLISYSLLRHTCQNLSFSFVAFNAESQYVKFDLPALRIDGNLAFERQVPNKVDLANFLEILAL